MTNVKCFSSSTTCFGVASVSRAPMLFGTWPLAASAEATGPALGCGVESSAMVEVDRSWPRGNSHGRVACGPRIRTTACISLENINKIK